MRCPPGQAPGGMAVPPYDPVLKSGMERAFDCLIVGAGIIGLAHALAAARRGLRVGVLDREARPIGASVRNFGFITVTGQQQGITWRRALRSRDVWAEVAPQAGIEVTQRGLLMCARRPEALRCLEEFAAGPMGDGCRVLRGDALRHPLREVFPAEFLQEFDRLRGEQGVSTLYKFRLPTPTGEARIANITIAPLLNRDFQAVGRIVIVDDITDRINMETQLTQAEKLSSIGLLAAGVAHEVNTPLAVISSYAQMLGKQLRSDEATHARLQPVLEKITQQSFRASEIVNGLLNFSRMGSVDFGRVEVNTMVRDTVLLLEHQMRSAGVVVATELTEDLPAVAGNRGKLQQVLVNLVLNAKDALQEKGSGSVRILTARTSKGVEIRVEDNGVGMSPEVLRKIYDPFFTTKSNPAEGQRKGTGLGLAVTYGIVQEHAGTIEVNSTPGEGTVFRLELPAADTTGQRPQHKTQSGKQPASVEGKVVHV